MSMKHFLPHSNGVYKVNMKRKLKPKEIIERVLLSILGLLLIGFLYQIVSNFIAKETLKQRVDYTRVDEKRLDYKINGSGKYTIVFDGNIGANLNQWNAVCEKISEEFSDVTTFVYNRRGYGYSDGGALRTPEEQAMDLKILLRKAAAPEPYILVGEEYGSLVLTEFAKQYPESVAGVVLVNPLMESEINSTEFRKDMIIPKIRRKIESIGSNFGFTTLLNKINLDSKLIGFEDKLDGEILKEFETQRTKDEYTEAVYNELTNITSGQNSIQQQGVLAGKPFYLIAKDGQESLSVLGEESLTKVYKTSTESNFVSMEDPEAVVVGIRQVIKEANDIERKNNKKE